MLLYMYNCVVLRFKSFQTTFCIYILTYVTDWLHNKLIATLTLKLKSCIKWNLRKIFYGGFMQETFSVGDL